MSASTLASDRRCRPARRRRRARGAGPAPGECRRCGCGTPARGAPGGRPRSPGVRRRRTRPAGRRRTRRSPAAATGSGPAWRRARRRPSRRTSRAWASASDSFFMCVMNRLPLTDEHEVLRRRVTPLQVGLRLLQRVERAVDLDRGQPGRGVRELLGLRAVPSGRSRRATAGRSSRTPRRTRGPPSATLHGTRRVGHPLAPRSGVERRGHPEPLQRQQVVAGRDAGAAVDGDVARPPPA